MLSDRVDDETEKTRMKSRGSSSTYMFSTIVDNLWRSVRLVTPDFPLVDGLDKGLVFGISLSGKTGREARPNRHYMFTSKWSFDCDKASCHPLPSILGTSP